MSAPITAAGEAVRKTTLYRPKEDVCALLFANFRQEKQRFLVLGRNFPNTSHQATLWSTNHSPVYLK